MNTNIETAAPSTEVGVSEVLKNLTKLEPHAKLSDVVTKVNEIVERMNSKRDRGPESTRTMIEEDARRIVLGDLKDASHTLAATTLGLSYGQVYSARKGFTFKTIYKEGERANRKV